ncbi:MAG TPA: alpha/beta fold hydrolase [Candidatus Binataceae bacterium]
MEVQLGRFPAELERPEPLKFAWPVVVLPGLFSTARHLAVLVGYLATIGWEVYAPELGAAAGSGSTPALSRLGFDDLLALTAEAIDQIGRDVIVIGHGAGGLIALKIAEQPRVKAAVAIAPLIPGYPSALVTSFRNRLALWSGRALNPPTGRTLFELVADADPFQREALIKSLVPSSAVAAFQIARGEVQLTRGENIAPRLIVAGDSDVFVPFERVSNLADSIGAKIAKIPGRGHWLIGGRGLERAINEIQRFLVRALGQELLLLYPEEWTE